MKKLSKTTYNLLAIRELERKIKTVKEIINIGIDTNN